MILSFLAIAIFAQTDVYYEKNLSLGYSDSADYVIVKGDNLWNLAKQYYGNGFEWRYIWEHNKYINDPHWIYPGNLLYIPGISSKKSVVITEAKNISLYDTSKTLVQLKDEIKKYPSQKQVLLVEKYKYYFSLEALRQAPFIYDRKQNETDNEHIGVFNYGEIANNNRQVLAQNQNVFVKMLPNVSFNLGESVSFYAVRDDLRCKNGIVCEPIAIGVVKYIDNDYTTVFVEKVYGILKNGAKAVPARGYKSIGDYLTYKELDDSLEVQSVMRMNPDVSFKLSEVLFIDKGSQNGVCIGDHITFYEQARKGTKKTHAEEPTADGLVIAVEKNTATVKITKVWGLSTSNLLVGVRTGKIIAR
jgi:hypothetical protein